MTEPLVLTFDPQTVDHLGAKMYSHLPNALAELVANAYDADARNVAINIEDGAVSIVDDGHGMSREDVREKYLHIGRNRRAKDEGLTESGRRRVSGKKGLGKLALFGIGKRVQLTTTRKGSRVRTQIELSYEAMMASDGAYHPKELSGDVVEHRHGTVVRLEDLKRSTPVNASELAASLSKLFNYLDRDFKVVVVALDGQKFQVTRELRLDSVDVEFEWVFPRDLADGDELLADRAVTGHIVSSTSPLRQGLRGVTLYVKGRMANEPEYFDASASSFAYSYLSGYLVADYLDGLEPDVIATDRRAIDWDTDETIALRKSIRNLLTRVATEWRIRRKSLRDAETVSQVGPIDDWVDSIKSSEREAVREIVAAIGSDDVDFTPDQQSEFIRLVKEVAPPHAEYAWRHLHEEIRESAEVPYLEGKYYNALQEAIKRFLSNVKKKSGTVEDLDSKILGASFGNNAMLRVFSKYEQAFKSSTANDIERGQLQISQGIVAGFRNPLAHEELRLLHETGAFNYDDCLDALSILSHLMRRLDDATVAEPTNEQDA